MSNPPERVVLRLGNLQMQRTAHGTGIVSLNERGCGMWPIKMDPHFDPNQNQAVLAPRSGSVMKQAVVRSPRVQLCRHRMRTPNYVSPESVPGPTRPVAIGGERRHRVSRSSSPLKPL